MKNYCLDCTRDLVICANISVQREQYVPQNTAKKEINVFLMFLIQCLNMMFL